MRKPIVLTNIADRATDEAFNIQVRQFINFLGERIDQMAKSYYEFDEHEIQSELRDAASEALKHHQLRLCVRLDSGCGERSKKQVSFLSMN